MNNRSKEIIEEAISQGKWTWLEIDNNSNSLYLEFENLKLSSQPIFDNSYRGELAIRFGQNIYLALFFNKKDDLLVNADVNLNLSCEAAYLIEESTGKVIYAQNETKKLFPASMTKMMGLLIVCEALQEKQIKKDDIVIISKEAASMGGSQVFLQPLEQISVDDLIKCVCIASANDAMYALSELIATTNQNFISMMNEKVKSLNLTNTNFVNVTGFDDPNHYTCAKDMATIALELLKYKDIILPYTSMYDSYIRQNTDNPFWLVNTNKMVKFYEGLDGLKTGVLM